MTIHIVKDYTYTPKYMLVTFCGALIEHSAKHASPEPDVTSATCITCLRLLRDKAREEIQAWQALAAQCGATLDDLESAQQNPNSGAERSARDE